MSRPRISVLAIMAIALVVAIDCMLFRSVAARPPFFAYDLWWAATTCLPMANVLALAALWSKGRDRDRRALIGFEVTGWAVVAACVAWPEPLRTWAIDLVVSLGAESYIAGSPAREAVIDYVAIPSLYFVPQLLLAVLGGLAARWGWRNLDGARGADRLPGRSRPARFTVFVLLVLLPFVAVEGYFRARVDPAFARFKARSLAVMDINTIPGFPSQPAQGTPLATLVGARVRIQSDTGFWCPQRFTDAEGAQHHRDLRMVSVTVLDGDQIGEYVLIPRFYLRPLP